MKQEELIEYWIQSSDLDFDSMMSLYQSKHYHWSLFIGHLVIEKLLKAIYIKKIGEHPPMIHNLLRLAQKSGIEMNNEMELVFAELTEFNILARYEDYKMEFYKRCTEEYTTKWITEISNSRQWIKNRLLS
jgi:HEPN domain-containing protein